MPALTYKPFTACDQLTNVALAGTNLRRGARGPGVRLIQGGLIDLGYKLPRSTQKHGAPDGIFGPELTLLRHGVRWPSVD
jgi:peptidoglycan hydrolase-like protein with peptidoglycan-binding domain